jgi:hypothetical protein
VGGSERETLSHAKRRPDMTPRHLVVAVTVIALAAVVSVPGAFAETRKCVGTLNGSTTGLDNVKVPRGATCTLSGVRLRGNIKVGADATLIATNVRVNGSIQGKEAAQVTVTGALTKVGGSVQLVEGGGVTLTTIRVKGDVQLFDNLGPMAITGNRIDGNLQCKENLPEPVGAGNLVQGNAEDQCEDLAL